MCDIHPCPSSVLGWIRITIRALRLHSLLTRHRHCVCCHDIQLAIIDILISKGTDLAITNRNGQTAEDVGRQGGHADVVLKLQRAATTRA
jgi:hypothetical protein